MTPDADINPENLRIIKSLAERQINSKIPWSADFIKKKGEGVVVLLHGPPGVGKTYTVENIALSVGRPLIALTIADLGTKEDSVEASLTQWFSFAQKWRAILLLDEADIFLERREHKDISRNGVVSAFLRKMEYFGGLLFLTTNRVGHIDEAFISRVHVIIGFEKLDPSKRKKIWVNFLDKLNRERKGRIRVTPRGRVFAQSDEMCTMEWNGREIRNALQTAIALAEYDLRESGEGDDSEILVEEEHFRRVMEMSRSFRAYMDSIEGNTEQDRARQFYARNDYYGSE
ncbi:P-loop containing nucleoside triphosphate hydrolase protein [Aspergillus taichungensis]|uniref:P-loop containing nucleoside triphosphate hydrolase protein n=1 Tax=Aspergillus taichungensis TaxID=482145 RepID=A0A2J5IA33_9EURO|nr:P-loop containing nucleoside triphosphate hydrolase protein [Aspergillus taichungensis]